MIKLKIKYGNDQTDLRFPCTEKALQEALAEIDAEQVRPLELYVTEVVFPEELAFLEDRFANLDEVNYLAKRMDSFFGDEEYQFYEAMKLEGFDTLPDLINLSFNLNRYPLIRDIGDMGKIGREYLLTVNGCVPADDADDPKYAELGRELIQSGNGIFTEHGMLFVDENTPFQRSYDGQTFPPYLYDPGVLCVAKAEYGGKTEYLYFPCEEEAIDKAFARLGTTADEVKITLEDFNTDSPEWFGRFREIASEEGVYELNRLTAVNTADMDLKKLWSVAEYAEAEDAEQLTRLARNIGCFTFIEGATSYAEVGRFFTETEDRYMLSFISLHKENWRSHSYAAACCVGDQVLFQMLKANPNIDTVCLCMDNDTAGQAANKRISDKLFIQGIKHEILVPEFKDWNEDLLCDEQEKTECQTLQL